MRIVSSFIVFRNRAKHGRFFILKVIFGLIHFFFLSLFIKTRAFIPLINHFFSISQIVETLLENGAHIDARNSHGLRPLDMLKNIPDCKINPLQYLTLRCLAASAIARNRLPYKREIPEIPTVLEEFIEAHWSIALLEFIVYNLIVINGKLNPPNWKKLVKLTENRNWIILLD